MEILYGIVMLLTFLIGFGVGISVPFFVKKYVESAKKEIQPTKVEIPEEEKEDKFKYIPKDLLNEWITGEEVKTNDEQ